MWGFSGCQYGAKLSLRVNMVLYLVKNHNVDETSKRSFKRAIEY